MYQHASIPRALPPVPLLCCVILASPLESLLKLSGIVPHLCKENNTALIAKERGPQEDFSSPSQYIFKKGKWQPSIAKFLQHPSVTL